ncbi:MAG: hypothetical protein HY395_01620 [Candidatus Doudnabacteria bacterium]|nr:hypothetical protein [Candidatus Doudnabacteria bacterium]
MMTNNRYPAFAKASADRQISNIKQAGVTMLFAVFVIASVSIISLTVGYFAIQEIRASRAVALSEPAIMAAETAGEEGLWLIKRSSGVANCSSGQQQEVLVDSKTVVSKCIEYDNAVVNVRFGKPFTFYLYDPNDINGNLNPGFENIVVTHVSGSVAASVIVQRIDGSNVSTTNVLSDSDPVTIDLPTSPLDDNRFKVTASSSGSITLDINTNLGMPDYPTLAAEGCAARSTDVGSCGTDLEAFKRRLNIIVPQ